MRKHTTKEIGDALEQRVATYYEALQYRVTTDVNLDGHQIDIIAEKSIPGAGVIVIAVEVKSRKNTLGVNDVTNFVSNAKHLMVNAKINSAAIVTDAKISKDAKLSVKDNSWIRLINIKDLETEIFVNTESLLRTNSDYQNSQIYKQYYPLSGHHDGFKISDISSYIQNWLSDESGLIILVGDFGSGKSTIIDHTFNEKIKQKISYSQAQFPVILKLRSLRKFSDLWSYVESQIRDNQYFQTTRVIFERELQSGRLCIFLDGFDEIYTGATIDDRAAYLHFLKPLLSSPSPCVLTSRPTIFESIHQMLSTLKTLEHAPPKLDRVPSAGIDKLALNAMLGPEHITINKEMLSNIVYISSLDDVEISQAIRRFSEKIEHTTGLSHDEFKIFLYKIYDLKDLMTRPLLLEMIIKATISGAIDVTSTKVVGPSTLYDIYTQMSAQRDESKGKADQFLTGSQRLTACRELAWAMHQKGETFLSSKDVESVVLLNYIENSDKNIVNKEIRRLDLERALTDIRTCSFLVFSADNSLTFAHRSFCEFFVAQNLLMICLKNRQQFLSYADLKLSKECIYFLASYARDQKEFGDYIKMRLGMESTAEQRDFLHRIAFGVGTLLRHCKYLYGNIDSVDMTRVDVAALYFRDVTINGCRIKDVVGEKWVMLSIKIFESSMEGVKLQNSEIEFFTRSLEIIDCDFTDSQFSIKGRDCAIDGTVFSRCKVWLAGTISLTSVRLFSVYIVFDKNLNLFSGSRFAAVDSRLYFQSSSIPYLASGASVVLAQSLVVGLFLNITAYIHGNNRSNGFVEFDNCRGLIILSFAADSKSEEALESIRKRNPELFIINSSVIGESRQIALRQERVFEKNGKDPQGDVPGHNLIPTSVGLELNTLKTKRELDDPFNVPDHVIEAGRIVRHAIRKFQLKEIDLSEELRILSNMVRD